LISQDSQPISQKIENGDKIELKWGEKKEFQVENDRSDGLVNCGDMLAVPEKSRQI
jgi:hypothetical protein